jgi:hypothetical protein
MKQTIKKLGIIAAAMIIALAFIACVGPAGRPGIDGADGENGIDGAQGEKGDKGDQGEAGEAGEKGDTGEPGDPSVYEAVIITFDSDGGSAVPSQKMSAGNWPREPRNPIKPIQGLDFESATTAGLYRNAYQFDGWHTEEGELFDFDTPITEDITLTARWSNPPVTLTGTSDVVTNAVDFINENPGGYTLLVDADVSVLTQQNLSANNTQLTLLGISSTKTITLGGSTTSASLFSVRGNNTTLTLGNSITIKGKAKTNGNAQSSACLITIGYTGIISTFIMKSGSKIEGHATSHPVPAVYISPNSTFIMEGGAITGNEGTGLASRPNDTAAVQCNGTFVMSGGSITGNTGTPDAADFNTNSSPSIILSGNAQIGGFSILINNSEIFIEVGSSNVRIGKLSLGLTNNSSATNTNTVRDYWLTKPVIKAAEGYALPNSLTGAGNIIEGYGKFLANMISNQTSIAISNYRIVNENGVGVLRQQ